MTALTVWTEPSGYSLGTFQERVTLDVMLPVTNDSGVTYSVISGALPNGLRLNNNHIVGTAYEVARATSFTFCIRAVKVGQGFADRTLTMIIEGADAPEFITAEGDLPLGDNQQYFVLDQTFVDFQIEAFDFDTSVGQKLSYFIASGDGQLPPGLRLTSDGRLVGFVEPALSITPADGDGTYDDSYYDAVAYDFAYRPTNGYDTYTYDNVFYDFNTASQGPRKLNRNYEFIVSVTDGDVTPSSTLSISGTGLTQEYTTSYVAKRKFKIFVVGDDYFRADNTTWLNGGGLFTADGTYLNAPIWVTPADLGMYRANNYLTIPLQTYDTINVRFELVQATEVWKANTVYAVNDLVLVRNDPIWNNTTTYIRDTVVVFDNLRYIALSNNINLAPTTASAWALFTPNSVNSITYICINAHTSSTSFNSNNWGEYLLPPGVAFDENTAELYGTVPYQPAITKLYRFKIKATRVSEKDESASSLRTFTLRLIGEIDSVITWNTDSNLNNINANFISTLSISATSTVPNSDVLYRITSGQLPPGLSLNLDGQIVGKVNQYSTPTTAGLTTFDFASGVTTFDNRSTLIDRVFVFTVEARDQYGYSATTREFVITVDTPNQLIYSNIRVKPFLKLSQRSLWKDFINNTNVFTPTSIYRTNDPSFGLQPELSMLIYAGIETTEAAKYISAIGLNHKRKRFQFGSIKKATAYKTGTNTAVYEVVYIQMIDPAEPNGKRLPNVLPQLGKQTNTTTVDSSNVFWSNDPSKLAIPAPTSERPDPIISIDSTGYRVSNSNPDTYFPNSVTNWQERLKNWDDGHGNGLATERNYLPLWMRSIQSGTKSELGFQLAVPLCYCKVGTADEIMLNIKFSGFDFKLLDYTADRYIIDSVEGETGDKYLVFRNDRITV